MPVGCQDMIAKSLQLLIARDINRERVETAVNIWKGRRSTLGH